MKLLLATATSLAFVGSLMAGVAQPAAAKTVLVASHPNCSGNPNSPHFQMGGCGGSAKVKHRAHTAAARRGPADDPTLAPASGRGHSAPARRGPADDPSIAPAVGH